MGLTKVYVGLGGNMGNARHTLGEALKLIKAHPAIYDLTVSNFYKTSPVSPLPQNHFINAVCSFMTTLTPHALLKVLQDIEKQLGKEPKAKEAPRIIDCDILLFGDESISTSDLKIPHSLWRERLFVLIPLYELTKFVRLPGRSDLLDLQAELRAFQNHNNENVQLLMEAI
jgi:2-amino-4-hydroxy-6-hydroxymethyldihydropteridine diphosphokinase